MSFASCGATGLTDYRLHDARHSYAVTAIKLGASLEHLAKLGHGSTQMVTSTYGRYVPTHDERRAVRAVVSADRDYLASNRWRYCLGCDRRSLRVFRDDDHGGHGDHEHQGQN